MECRWCEKKKHKRNFNVIQYAGEEVTIKICDSCLPREEAREWYIKNELSFLKGAVANKKRRKIVSAEIESFSKDEIIALLETESFYKEGEYVYRRYKGIVVPEHRLIYSLHNGRIPKNYVVHHKDGNKTNNNIENLQAMSKKAHNELHGYFNKKV